MGRICSTCGGRGEEHTEFWWGNLRRETTWKTQRRRENNIKMDLQDFGWGMGLIDVAQNRDRWRALVNAVMNHRVP